MVRRNAFPRVCVALGLATAKELLQHARQEALAGERFLEFRLDYLENPEQGIAAMRRVLTEYPDVVALATCRRQQSHGLFAGGIEEQLRILQAAVKAGAAAVDIEIETAERARAALGAFNKDCLLVISYHNFSSTPAMEALLRRMTKHPASAYKIVVTARKPSDLHRLLAIARTCTDVPMILLSMDAIGFPSRVVSCIYGGLYTYAAPQSVEGTASGQVTAKTLRNLYRIEKLGRATKLFGVIADPVGHSISPAVHNRAFQSQRIDAVYLPFLVHAPHLKDFLLTAEKLPVSGFSVTIPHKEKILRHLDVVDPLARRIGAVNTVWRKAGKWRGTNTDAAAVTGPLSKHLRLGKSSVLVAGSGGAARAACFALADAGARLSITGRNAIRVRALAAACGAEALSLSEVETRRFDAVVHATPVGMYPRAGESLFPGSIPADLVFDMVYNPLETELLRRARNEKKLTIHGLEMFLAQAAEQFQIWTGTSAPRGVMETAARDALGIQKSNAGRTDK